MQDSHENTYGVVWCCYIIVCKQCQEWRHHGRDSVSNHQSHDCLLNRLSRRRSKKTANLRVTGLCGGNSPGTGEFLAQRAGNTENVFIWWRHHARYYTVRYQGYCVDCWVKRMEIFQNNNNKWIRIKLQNKIHRKRRLKCRLQMSDILSKPQYFNDDCSGTAIYRARWVIQ